MGWGAVLHPNLQKEALRSPGPRGPTWSHSAKPTLAFEQEAGSKQRETGRPRRESVWRVPDRFNVESLQDPARPRPGPRPREPKTGCSQTRDHAHPRQPTVGTTPGPSTPWLGHTAAGPRSAVSLGQEKARIQRSVADPPGITCRDVLSEHSDTKATGCGAIYRKGPGRHSCRPTWIRGCQGRGVTAGGAGVTVGLRKVPRTAPHAPRAAAPFTSNRARVCVNVTPRKRPRGRGGGARGGPAEPGWRGGHAAALPKRGRSALASRGSWGISSGPLRSAAATREARARDIVWGD